MEWSRREFLGGGSALAAAAWAGPGPACAVAGPRRTGRIAAVNTVYHLRSHAYHIVGRFLFGYPIDGFHHQPDFKVVRMYNDQYPANDLSRGLSARFGFELSKTVADALGGAKGLDVDGVLLIGEHGSYPENELGQQLYPRHRLFMEIVDCFRKSGRSVPVFSDKHLSTSHREAAEMVEASRKLGFGFMAGSSLPVTWRRPEMEPPLGTPFTEALVCCYGGVERYGFHGLEVLQCMMERRSSRESGVEAVTALRGAAVWKAGEEGRWSGELLEAALSRSPSRNVGDPRDNVADPVAFLLEYKDGARGAVLLLNEHVADFTFAARVKGRRDPVSTLFYLPAPPGARYFSAQTYNIEKLFTAGKSPYPVERTWLTTNVLEFAHRSLAAGGKRLADPALAVAYDAPRDSGYMRGRYTDA
jgi:hypothetical protein